MNARGVITVTSEFLKHSSNNSKMKGCTLMNYERLLCEYFENPIHIDVENPRFSWIMSSNTVGEMQTAYQINVYDVSNSLVWNSGKVSSSRSTNNMYSGEKLSSQSVYTWTVCVWTNKGECLLSKVQSFETALMSENDWGRAYFVAAAAQLPGRAVITRTIQTIEKTVRKARAYISGLGYSELYINSTKAGKNVLDPGYTEYSKRYLYVTHDVTSLIKQGENIIDIWVGNGWNASPIVRFKLTLWYDDGSIRNIVSGPHGSGFMMRSSPIIENSIFDGETYDARIEETIESDLSKASGWFTPYAVGGPGGKASSQMIEPITVTEEIMPLSIVKTGDNQYVVDMGQNFAGWIAIRACGKRGEKLVIRYAENLYEDGTVNQENLRSAKATDTYIFKGHGIEYYEPRFTYHGFRYVQIEAPCEILKENVVGKAVHSNIARKSTFNCGNNLINQIYRNVIWTERSNLHSIPTDCPQRDERQGWLNDLTVRAEESLYNFDMAKLYTKWLFDVDDTMNDEGAIADTAPYKWGKCPADPVSSSYLIIPWLVYTHYNDEKIIADHFNNFERWEAFLLKNSTDYIVNYSYYGDWASPITETIAGSLGDGAVSSKTPGQLISTGYSYLNCVLLSKMSRLLGFHDKEIKYTELAKRIARRFNEVYFDNIKRCYGSGSQGANSFALYIGLVSDENRQAVLDSLVNDIVERDYHLSTGNLCSKYILEVLTENGMVDLAYRLVTQTTYPSWGHMIENGATTIWERWEHATGGEMNSHNHPMFASVGSWFIKYLAGIQFGESHGEGWLRIKPYIPCELEFAEAKITTIYGDVTSKWEKKEDKLLLTLEIPFNCTANVSIPVQGREIAINGVSFDCSGKDEYIFSAVQGKYDIIVS